LQGVPHTYGTTGIAFMAFWLFQFAFADTASTIVSGAMVGRTSFKGDLLYSVGVTGFIYPIFGHWVWGPNGWLATMDTPFRDFAGIGRIATNTTLAACAGSLTAVAWIYRRTKKFDTGISINGLLAGLVAITCPCYWVSPTGAVAIGAIAGVIVVVAVDFTEWI